MMKKRIVMVLLTLILAGCSQGLKDEPEKAIPKTVAETPATTPEKVPSTETVPEVEPEVETPVENTPVTSTQTRSEYIQATFAEYGYITPDESTWIVKEEGPEKISVIIKEYQDRGKPKISKLIFLEGEPNTILFLQVNNEILLDN